MERLQQSSTEANIHIFARCTDAVCDGMMSPLMPEEGIFAMESNAVHDKMHATLSKCAPCSLPDSLCPRL